MAYDAQGNYTSVVPRDPNTGMFNTQPPVNTQSSGVLTAQRAAPLISKEVG